MTDENVIRLPASHDDEPETETDDTRQDRQPEPRPASDEDESNPLTREGPDAPDAADIEDPDQQL